MNAPPEIEASEPPTNEMPPTASAIAAVESASEPVENHDHLSLQVPTELDKPLQAGDIVDARQMGQLGRKKPVMLGVAGGLAICLLLGTAALVLVDDAQTIEQEPSQAVSNTPAIKLGATRTQGPVARSKDDTPVKALNTQANTTQLNRTPKATGQRAESATVVTGVDSKKTTEKVGNESPVEKERRQPPEQKRDGEKAKKAVGSASSRAAKAGRSETAKTSRASKQKSVEKKKKKRDASRETKRVERSKKRKRSRAKKTKTDDLFGATKDQNQGLPFSLTHQQIVRVLGKKGSSLKRCTAKDKSLRGAKVMVSITILRTGKPTKIRAISSSVRGTDVGRCIERTLGTSRFPKFRGDNMRMTVPVRI